MFYKGFKHKKKFMTVIRSLKCPVCQMKTEFLSALFLLTTSDKLWNKAMYAVTANEIAFKSIDIKGINSDEYTLFKASQDIVEGTRHFDFVDLGDNKVIGDNIFELIKKALNVRRYGIDALKINNTILELNHVK
ncbi:MAG: hypothetical protein ACYCWE_00075 [Eubacteriales bacterium]